ncbi:hypothetical protein APF79_04390 [bacterium BRH_c32]|nr:MAG: hypothetical protein APF79_04390 [bacterium BRH_c32]
MPLTNAQLRTALNKLYTIPVEIYTTAPLPINKTCYDPLRNLPQTGFTFKVKELLHVIGCKTAALPMSQKDEAIRSAHLYTNILDFSSNNFSYLVDVDSDLQTSRSNEMGIGFMCLLANKYFKIPWDKLESIPGKETRFDYRGKSNGLNCIFEAKGTKHSYNQKSQVEDSIRKKEHYHAQNHFNDIELIVSSFIGAQGSSPRLLIGDPKFRIHEYTFSKESNYFFKMRHYTRVLQFAGLTSAAYSLYNNSRKYFKTGEILSENVKSTNENEISEYEFNDIKFLGMWTNNWLPEKSKRYQNLYKYDYSKNSLLNSRIFQGIRTDYYENILRNKLDLIGTNLKDFHKIKENMDLSIFSDGSIQVFSD